MRLAGWPRNWVFCQCSFYFDIFCQNDMFCRSASLSLPQTKGGTCMGSRTEGLQCLLVIINKLKGNKRYIPARELKRYIAEAMEMRGYSGKSGRTLERDIDDIQSLFGISIAYAKREQGYYIKEEDESIPERYGKVSRSVTGSFFRTSTCSMRWKGIRTCARMCWRSTTARCRANVCRC